MFNRRLFVCISAAKDYTCSMDAVYTTTDTGLEKGGMEIAVWHEKYDTGIELIDKQHKELVNIINKLHRACCTGASVDDTFKGTMHQMVEYVRFHFGTEQRLLERLKYPGCKAHIKEHSALVQNILDAAKSFSEGKRFVPHSFARTLRDWLLGHIAVSDKHYAAFVMEQKKKGLNLDSIFDTDFDTKR